MSIIKLSTLLIMCASVLHFAPSTSDRVFKALEKIPGVCFTSDSELWISFTEGDLKFRLECILRTERVSRKILQDGTPYRVDVTIKHHPLYHSGIDFSVPTQGDNIDAMLEKIPDLIQQVKDIISKHKEGGSSSYGLETLYDPKDDIVTYIRQGLLSATLNPGQRRVFCGNNYTVEYKQETRRVDGERETENKAIVMFDFNGDLRVCFPANNLDDLFNVPADIAKKKPLSHFMDTTGVVAYLGHKENLKTKFFPLSLESENLTFGQFFDILTSYKAEVIKMIDYYRFDYTGEALDVGFGDRALDLNRRDLRNVVAKISVGQSEAMVLSHYASLDRADELVGTKLDIAPDEIAYIAAGFLNQKAMPSTTPSEVFSHLTGFPYTKSERPLRIEFKHAPDKPLCFYLNPVEHDAENPIQSILEQNGGDSLAKILVLKGNDPEASFSTKNRYLPHPFLSGWFNHPKPSSSMLVHMSAMFKDAKQVRDLRLFDFVHDILPPVLAELFKLYDELASGPMPNKYNSRELQGTTVVNGIPICLKAHIS